MEYKGYVARVEFDDSANTFHGEVLNLRDVITFEGESVEELWREFRESVDDYLEYCASRGEEPEKPFSGKFLVRIEPGLHRAAAVAAGKAGESLNTWVSKAIGSALVPNRSTSEALEQHLAHAFRTVLRKQAVLSFSRSPWEQASMVFSQSSEPVKSVERFDLLGAISNLGTIDDWVES